MYVSGSDFCICISVVSRLHLYHVRPSHLPSFSVLPTISAVTSRCSCRSSTSRADENSSFCGLTTANRFNSVSMTFFFFTFSFSSRLFNWKKKPLILLSTTFLKLHHSSWDLGKDTTKAAGRTGDQPWISWPSRPALQPFYRWLIWDIFSEILGFWMKVQALLWSRFDDCKRSQTYGTQVPMTTNHTARSNKIAVWASSLILSTLQSWRIF